VSFFAFLPVRMEILEAVKLQKIVFGAMPCRWLNAGLVKDCFFALLRTNVTHHPQKHRMGLAGRSHLEEIIVKR